MNNVAFSADGLQAFATLWSGSVVSLDVPSLHRNPIVSGISGIYYSALQPSTDVVSDSFSAFFASAQGMMGIHGANPAEIYNIPLHRTAVSALVFSPDGETVLSGAIDGDIVLSDLETGEPIRRFEGHGYNAAALAFSPDGSTALSGGVGGSLAMWDVTTGEVL